MSRKLFNDYLKLEDRADDDIVCGFAVWCVKQDEGFEKYPMWPAAVETTQEVDGVTKISLHFFGDHSQVKLNHATKILFASFQELVKRAEVCSFLPHLSHLSQASFKKDPRWQNAVLEVIEVIQLLNAHNSS